MGKKGLDDYIYTQNTGIQTPTCYIAKNMSYTTPERH